VLESGLGDGLQSWAPIFDVADGSLDLFAYSRPGYGGSAANPALDAGGRRTGEAAARFLDATLRAAEIAPPYVLVGHSLGGLYITAYARLFTAKAAALVYVDGRPSAFFDRCVRDGLTACATRRAPGADWPAHIAAELIAMPEAEAQGLPTPAIAAIPATIITATAVIASQQDGARVRAAWIEEQERFAAAFTNHRFVRAEGAGHYIHRDQPALVAAEIARRARG
jgi:pimeloyl-ACP methyl ester carboxylesterase